MLTEEIAREIVKETMIRLNRNINIMDDKGTIIASGDAKRVHHTHFAAKKVMETGETVVVNEQNTEQYQGALPGINLPIVFDEKIVGVIGITGQPNELMEFGQLVKMSTEMMLRQHVLTERMEWRQHMIEVVFNELVSGEFDLPAIQQRLRLLGIELTPPYQVAVAEVKVTEISKGEIIQQVQHYFDKTQALIGFQNVHRLFILGFQLTEERFQEKLRSLLNDIRLKDTLRQIGIGSIAATDATVRYAYEEALCALKLGSDTSKLVSYAEIEIKALLSRLHTRARRQFADRVLEQLNPKLIETVETFIRHDLNIGKCAESMYIHRNSLNYRLKKIQEQTGYDPRIFHDAMTLQLAIWISRMEVVD